MTISTLLPSLISPPRLGISGRNSFSFVIQFNSIEEGDKSHYLNLLADSLKLRWRLLIQVWFPTILRIINNYPLTQEQASASVSVLLLYCTCTGLNPVNLDNLVVAIPLFRHHSSTVSCFKNSNIIDTFVEHAYLTCLLVHSFTIPYLTSIQHNMFSSFLRDAGQRSTTWGNKGPAGSFKKTYSRLDVCNYKEWPT